MRAARTMGGMTFEYQSVVLHDPEHPLHERCVDAGSREPRPGDSRR
jgi:hypothetical protein